MGQASGPHLYEKLNYFLFVFDLRLLLPNKIKNINFGRTDSEPNEPTRENNNKHNGKTRTFPHERGNWATYVYIRCKYSRNIIIFFYLNISYFTGLETESMQFLQQHIIDFFQNYEQIQFHPIDNLHLSLTRTIVLKHHWIGAFVESIKEILVNIKKFKLHLDNINVYCNDDKTRTFVSLTIADTDTHPIKELVKQFDKCLEEFKMSKFYVNASFHVSVLWCLGDERLKITQHLDRIKDKLDQLIVEDPDEYQINVMNLECKAGNRLYSFPLQ